MYNLFNWNGITISVNFSGSKKHLDFVAGIKKYFYANLVKQSDSTCKENCDISIFLTDNEDKLFPELDKNAKHIKKGTLIIKEEYEFDLYNYNEKLWYFYHGIAAMRSDYKTGKIFIKLLGKLFEFSYYNILLFFLNPLSSMLENFGYFRAHASCVNIGKNAVLFTGDSGSGKSTSAFAVSANGGSIISDDMTFLKKTGNNYNVFTITRLVKIMDDMQTRFFPEIIKYKSLINDEGEIYYDVDLLNRRTLSNAFLKAITILEKTGNNETCYEKIHPSAVVPHIFPTSVRTNIEKFAEREFIFFTDLLNDVTCYKVYFGTDMAGFYNSINDILKHESKILGGAGS